MFIRSIKVRSSSGTVHEYVRIVASVRENGRVRQAVVANLGRRDTLEAVLPLLNRFLQGESDPQQQLPKQLTQDGLVEVLDSSTWGPMLVARHLFQKLGLWQLLDAGRRWPKLLPNENPDDDWPSRVLVLLANRLVRPGSEHALAAWLETDYICDRAGRRYIPSWKQHGRVQVDLVQLQRWYRTLDHLMLNKETIEVALYHRLRDLFHFQPELVFFDITSTYFEGHGPAMAKHGHSRDCQPRKVQVIVGVVMVAGWPIAHYVWSGNTRDSKTVKEVIEDLAKRFAFSRVVFVGDRGMVTKSNLKMLQESEDAWGFLLGMSRRRNPEVESLIDRVREDAWIDCPVGINAREKGKDQPRTRVQQVTCDRPGVRVFVVDSEERRAYEERMRTKAMERVRVSLEGVQARVAKGKLKKPEKIGAAVERALQRNHGYRYYAWKLEDGQLKFFEHPVNLLREKKYEGKYLIQYMSQTDTEMSAVDAVTHYKELSDVERGFRTVKDPLAMRPIWHHADRRVRAHIFVAALAFLLDRMLERALRDARVALSSSEAWHALETIRHVRLLVNGETRSGVTPGSPRARQVLKALNLNELQPPTPPEGEETAM
jgi:transposase